MKGNNELVLMTRRYPNLAQKILKRDSEIAKKIISAWDNEKSEGRVMQIFIKENKNLSDERYWELLRTVWIICGSVSRSHIFKDWMLSKRKERYYFSTPEESKKLREMPETFEVYRATNDENDGGIAWTLSKEYAEYYKEQFKKEKIITRTVNRKEVFAFIDRNLESEIILIK